MKKADRQKVFDKYGGRCAYCGCELDGAWQVDHTISKNYWFYWNQEDPKRVNDIENLSPACNVCNHYKRGLCVEKHLSHTGFRSYMATFHLRLAKLPKKTRREKTEKRKMYMMRIAERYGITPDKPFSGVFYFETIKQQ